MYLVQIHIIHPYVNRVDIAQLPLLPPFIRQPRLMQGPSQRHSSVDAFVACRVWSGLEFHHQLFDASRSAI
ncbi:unnamed protein product [Periconia digitata]|uniref:Uncharacterized protein n=1 Tax=Periconia digitata TaxID=1303443 RepID=A0A9W4UJ85_9PLEO|nr:unnamed protein product [Periconia digitata]